MSVSQVHIYYIILLGCKYLMIINIAAVILTE